MTSKIHLLCSTNSVREPYTKLYDEAINEDIEESIEESYKVFDHGKSYKVFDQGKAEQKKWLIFFQYRSSCRLFKLKGAFFQAGE